MVKKNCEVWPKMGFLGPDSDPADQLQFKNMVKLGEVLKHRKRVVQIDNSEKHKRCRVQTAARGTTKCSLGF
jgi:hypothetical protein